MPAKVITVTPDSSQELKDRVYRLTYQVYVEEMKHNLTNEERMLHDKYDEY
jgi:N-acyl-L-homoserine lactone synthetase